MPRLPPRWAFGLRLVLTVACLAAGWRWWSQQPRWEGLAFHWPWFLAALGLTPLILLLRAAKWRACLRGLPETPGLWQSLRSYVGALPLAMLTPGRAGELARPLYFQSPALRKVEASGRLLLDNWTDTLAVLLWSLPGCAWLWGWAGLGSALAVFLILAWIPRWLALVRAVLGVFRKGTRLDQVKVTVLRWLPSPQDAGPGLILPCLAWGLMAYALELLQFLVLLKVLGENEAPWLPLAGGLALVHLANSMQFTVAGIGPREGLTVWLLAKLGLGEGVLLSAASLQTLLVLLFPAAIGLAIKPILDEK